MKIKNGFRPNYIIHPGQILNSDLLILNISKEYFSKISGVDLIILTQIINEEINVNRKTGKAISLALNYPSNFYFSLQKFYNVTKKRLEKETKRLN